MAELKDETASFKSKLWFRVYSYTEGRSGDDIDSVSTPFRQLAHKLWRINQPYLDMTKPYRACRWIVTLVIGLIYRVKAGQNQGFVFVHLCLLIYLVNLFFGFMSPRVDLDKIACGSDPFKPFIPRLPEFKFWYSLTNAICVTFIMTFFSVFSSPVSWPCWYFVWSVVIGVFLFSMIRSSCYDNISANLRKSMAEPNQEASNIEIHNSVRILRYMEGRQGVDIDSVATPFQQLEHELWRIRQHFLDRTKPYLTYRWIITLILAFVFILRVYYIQGFFVISYVLGLYHFDLFIGFTSFRVDLDRITIDPDAFKTFIPRLPEFKFWYSLTKAICIVFLMTFCSLFDIPESLPICICYWTALFGLVVFSQIRMWCYYKTMCSIISTKSEKLSSLFDPNHSNKLNVIIE